MTAPRKPTRPRRSSRAEPPADAASPRLLSGGNPQIARGDGDAPVEAYLAALPGWKGPIGRRIDALVALEVPGVRRAVKWNTPFYGVAGRGWFLAFHAFTRYMKVTFFRGAELDPPPPVASKVAGTRYLHLAEGEAIDEAQLRRWIRAASERPGGDGLGPC
jgi:hypothetical protein